jgi:hypothetical protein
MVVASPMESEEHPKLPNVVRGRFPLAMKLVKEGECTKVEYVIQIDFGGSVPAQVTNSYMSSNLGYVTRLQLRFQKRRGLQDWGAEDGGLVGDALCTRTEAEKLRDKGETAAAARVREMFESYAGLKEAGGRFVFLPQLVTAAAENTLSLGADVKKRLDQLGEADGRKIGQVRAASERSERRAASEAIPRCTASAQFILTPSPFSHPCPSAGAREHLGGDEDGASRGGRQVDQEVPGAGGDGQAGEVVQADDGGHGEAAGGRGGVGSQEEIVSGRGCERGCGGSLTRGAESWVLC